MRARCRVAVSYSTYAAVTATMSFLSTTMPPLTTSVTGLVYDEPSLQQYEQDNGREPRLGVVNVTNGPKSERHLLMEPLVPFPQLGERGAEGPVPSGRNS